MKNLTLALGLFILGCTNTSYLVKYESPDHVPRYFADIFTIRNTLFERGFYKTQCIGDNIYCSQHPQGFFDIKTGDIWCVPEWEHVPKKENDCLNFNLPLRIINDGKEIRGILLLPNIRKNFP